MTGDYLTGPEHYREAERLADLAIRQYEREPACRKPDAPPPLSTLTMAQALVHAQLATAASIIATSNTRPSADWTAVTTGAPLPIEDS